ncbi:DNA-directed RNA polymerase subunit alpha [Candidatus Wolfebacteria bacterium]|nr:DNA-directed RNA polymerase subunit alpha [Candidatus Wolfebacteria bacterium]
MEYKKLSESVLIKKVSETPTEGTFEIEGLYTGYGLTIGNALRRALLSSLPGAAVTQVKIHGVKHEFSTIEGVAEDVLELSLNLKKIRFKFHADEPQVLTLEVKGEKDVKAKDIKTNAQVEIVNPDLIIATLTSKKAELKMELTIEKGLGYVSVENRKAEKLPVGVVAIDAIFTPVTKVNFVIENMRVGEKTDYNRLKLFIETDGTIAPSTALHKSANILKDHFEKISAIEEKMEEKKEEVKEIKKKKKKGEKE